MSTPSDADRGGPGAEAPQRSFNTAGPCRPATDYMLPPLDRLPEAIGLVERQKYFVVHAPRQSGKTTTIEAIAQELTRSGRHAALAVSASRRELPGGTWRRRSGGCWPRFGWPPRTCCRRN